MTKDISQTITLHDRHMEILHALYRFRFLNRLHIQKLLHHKTFSLIITWLNMLTASSYIKRYYNPKQITQPAYYSLGTKGRQYLRTNHTFSDVHSAVLDRVWRESKASEPFKRRCMMVADIYLSLEALVEKTQAKLLFKTQTDLYGMKYLVLPSPDAYFAIKEHSGRSRAYFLDVFEEHPTHRKLYDRIQRYFSYYEGNYWQDHSPDPFPNIIFVCPEAWALKYLYRKIQYRLENADPLKFYLTTRDQILTKGMSPEILQKVETAD